MRLTLFGRRGRSDGARVPGDRASATGRGYARSPLRAAAFEHAVKQIPARRWLGLTATAYRRDKLDDLIAMQVGPVRHTIALSRGTAGQDTLLDTGRPAPVLYVHPTGYRYDGDGDADPSRPGGIAAIYRDLAADEQRTRQVIGDVLAALSKDRNCLVLTNRTSHLEELAGLLREAGHDPVILRGGMGARSRAAALARLQPQPSEHTGNFTSASRLGSLSQGPVGPAEVASVVVTVPPQGSRLRSRRGGPLRHGAAGRQAAFPAARRS